MIEFFWFINGFMACYICLSWRMIATLKKATEEYRRASELYEEINNLMEAPSEDGK